MTTPDSPEALARFHDHLDLCEIIARHVGRGVPNAALDELLSFAREGLLDAARRYDPERGVPFRAFASYRVRGSVIDGLRSLAHLPRRVHERLRALEAAGRVSEGVVEDLQGGAPPGSARADAERALNDHLANMATAMATGIVSQTVPGEDGPDHLSLDAPADEQLERAQLLQLIQEGIAELPEQERELVQRHYFEGERFDHVAAELGLSKSWASRLHTRAIGRLTKRLQQKL
ncbi:MAG: sigma-70 family RNA polymerase sigma factor [Polyangiaceae bacterium]|nr:sigma-70 family RNA polymerase sigma factor [Polyangiaceae bacterium]MCB9607946.1 sigma-70 family RNA polymerase sigma factor [Polyangiaceae bacterium]